MRRVDSNWSKRASLAALAFTFLTGAFASASIARAQGRDAPTPMPAGHAPVGNPMADDDEEAPAPGPNPHGGGASPHGGGGGGAPGMFDAQPDVVDEDAAHGAGTISLEVVDPTGKPLPHTRVVLGILHNTVAKGEKREELVRESDADGKVLFENLEHVNGVAYRVTVPKDGAVFAAAPFSLPREKGIHVVLHVYPVVHDVIPLDKLNALTADSTRDKALMVFEAILFAELKDDRIQVQQLFRVVNAGGNAYVPPTTLVTALPTGFTALVNGAQDPTDVGIDADPKGPRWHGTFPPGKHEVTYRWQLPWANEKEVSFDIAMPPNVVSMRVMMAASEGMRLAVDGFPAGEPQTDSQGQRMLVTEKQLKRGDNLITSVRISMKDLPVVGPERIVVTGLAGITLLVGLAFAIGSRRPETPKEDAKARRLLLLADLEELERAHRAGDIGPKTYERTRRQLIDGIARTLVKANLATPNVA